MMCLWMIRIFCLKKIDLLNLNQNINNLNFCNYSTKYWFSIRNFDDIFDLISPCILLLFF